jgi:folylpolyglutamate synthase/dihydropteroate synthase
LTDLLRPHDAALERLRALHPQKIELSLTRMERLCEILERPERRLPPVIHVAGTNGKGSTMLLAFAETPADLCLIEVGLGGRYDATNVIERPAITVIAPVALDHCEFLGATIDKIAGEKAGIIKHGVPCVSARQLESASIVIREAAARAGAPLVLAGRDFEV